MANRGVRLVGRRAFLAFGAVGALSALAGCQQPRVFVSDRPPGEASQAKRLAGPAARSAVARAAAAPAPRPIETSDSGELQRELARFMSLQGGAFGVAIRDLHGPVAAAHHPDDRFVLGSLYKLVLASEVMRQARAGRFALLETVETLPEYTFGEPPGGVPPATRLPIDEMLRKMIAVSSNAAALALVELVGPDALSAAPQRLAMPATTIEVTTVAPGRHEIDARGTARDLLGLCVRLDREQLIGPDHDRRMIDLLLGQQIDDRFPRLLPADVPIAHKTADLEGYTHDAGIVYLSGRPFAIVVLAQALNLLDGTAIVAEICRLAFQYFKERS